jgi:hypothetical protein
MSTQGCRIQIDLAGTLGEVNYSRLDAGSGSLVTFYDTGDGDLKEWALVDKPYGSTATLSMGDPATMSTDLPGTYRVRLIKDGGELEHDVRYIGVTYRYVLPTWTHHVWPFTLASAVRIPAYKEGLEFNASSDLTEGSPDTNDFGWAQENDFWFRRIMEYGFGLEYGSNERYYTGYRYHFRGVGAPAAITRDDADGSATVDLTTEGGDFGFLFEKVSPAPDIPFEVLAEPGTLYYADTDVTTNRVAFIELGLVPDGSIVAIQQPAYDNACILRMVDGCGLRFPHDYEIDGGGGTFYGANDPVRTNHSTPATFTVFPLRTAVLIFNEDQTSWECLYKDVVREIPVID